jgi:hypothetical protein
LAGETETARPAKPCAAVSRPNGSRGMFLRDVIASLARRWYLTLAGLLATAGLAFVALQLVPPEWESKASVVLLPPKSTVESGGNPYLQLSGLAPTLDLLVVSLGDQRMTQLIKSVSPSAEYTAEADTTSSGPVMIVTVHDRTPANSVAVRDELVRQAPIRLAELQDTLSIPPRSFITSMVLAQDEEPQIVGKDQLRAVVVAAGAGVVGTALLVALIDGYLSRRRLAVVGGAYDFKERSTQPPADPEVPRPAAEVVKSTNGQLHDLRTSNSLADGVDEESEPVAALADQTDASSEPPADPEVPRPAAEVVKSTNGQLHHLRTSSSLAHGVDEESERVAALADQTGPSSKPTADLEVPMPAAEVVWPLVDFTNSMTDGVDEESEPVAALAHRRDASLREPHHS